MTLFFLFQPGKDLLDTVQSVPRQCNIGVFLILLPQIYWFFLMSKGCVKMLFPPPQKVEEESKKDK